MKINSYLIFTIGYLGGTIIGLALIIKRDITNGILSSIIAVLLYFIIYITISKKQKKELGI